MGTRVTIKGSGVKFLLKKQFFSLKKEKAQNHPGGRGGTGLSPGVILYGRVEQGVIKPYLSQEGWHNQWS